MLGRYEIRSLLGAGGMGGVYLAYDTRLRRQVAIKLLPGEFTQNKVLLSHFEREAYAASSLNHPNILTIHEIGSDDGHHFIATEYVEGESLRQHMSRTGMELRGVLDVAQQVTSVWHALQRSRATRQKDGRLIRISWPSGKMPIRTFSSCKKADESTKN